MDLTTQEGKNNLRDYIREVAEEVGVSIERIKIEDRAALDQAQIMLAKKVKPRTFYKRRAVLSRKLSMEQVEKDPSIDPVAQEIEQHVRSIKEDLTEYYEYNGHSIVFYPHDNGQLLCQRCGKEFEFPRRRARYTTPQKKKSLKRYIHGWASQLSCDEVLDRRVKYGTMEE